MSQTGPPEGSWSGAGLPEAGPSGAEPPGGLPASPSEPTGQPSEPDGPPSATASDAPGWTQPEPEKTGSGSSLIRKLAIPVVILIVVVGALVFRDRLSGSAGELVVGDCFDAPSATGTTGPAGVEISDVQHHPCSEAHLYEVFAVLKHPAATGDAYPGPESLFTYADTNCAPPFAAYVGLEYQQSTLGFGSLVPRQRGWESGDRAITCYLAGPDGSPVTGSLRSSKR